MPDVKLSIGGMPLAIEATGELARFVRPDVPLLLKVGGALAALGTKTFDDAADTVLSADFSPDRDVAWEFGPGVAVTVGFDASAKGVIELRKSGAMFSYAGADGREVSVTVPGGMGCVSVVFSVSLDVAGGAGFSSGSFGVKADGGAGSRFRLANYKLFPSSMAMLNAVRLAFEQFRFPFDPGNSDLLQDSECIDFEFAGKLGLGLGATFGMSGPVLGGRSNGELARSFESALGRAVISAKPVFEAAAAFSVRYDHEGTFRVVIQKQKTTASLYLFRADSSVLGIGANAGITLSADASVNLEAQLADIVREAGQRLVGGLPEDQRAAALDAFRKRLETPEAEGQLNRFIAEANSRVASLLKRLDGQKLELQVLHERMAKNTALFHYTFDLTQADAREGYALALQGRYFEAVAKKGVDLLPGSAVEREFIRRTAVRFQLFDVGRFVSATEYFDRASVVYAGDGVFRLLDTIGVKHEQGRIGHEQLGEIFFTAEHLRDADTGSFADLVVKLHFRIMDRANPAAAEKSARMLRAISATLWDPAERLRTLVSKNAAAEIRIDCAFVRSALEGLRFDAQPSPLPHPADQANYNLYVIAVNALESGAGFHGEGFPNLFESWENWAVFNRNANGGPSSTRPPDRRSAGNLARWPAEFSSSITDTLQRREVATLYLDAARRFMNVCETLRRLADDLSDVDTDQEYGALLETLSSVRDGVPVLFYRATLVALCRATLASIDGVQVEETDDGLQVSFEAARSAVART